MFSLKNSARKGLKHVSSLRADTAHSLCDHITCRAYSFYEIIVIIQYSSDESFQRSWEGYFGVYFPCCEATRELNPQITLEWAQKRFVTRVHTLFYILHDITNP